MFLEDGLLSYIGSVLPLHGTRTAGPSLQGLALFVPRTYQAAVPPKECVAPSGAQSTFEPCNFGPATVPRAMGVSSARSTATMRMPGFDGSWLIAMEPMYMARRGPWISFCLWQDQMSSGAHSCLSQRRVWGPVILCYRSRGFCGERKCRRCLIGAGHQRKPIFSASWSAHAVDASIFCGSRWGDDLAMPPSPRYRSRGAGSARCGEGCARSL